MKNRIIIAAAFTACLALCAAVWPQTEKVGKTPAPSETAAVTTPRSTLPEPEELILPEITEKQESGMPEAESAQETTTEELPVPAPEIEDEPMTEQKSAPPTQTDPTLGPRNLNRHRSQKLTITNWRIWSMSPALAGYKAKAPTMSSMPRICTRTATKLVPWADLKKLRRINNEIAVGA